MWHRAQEEVAPSQAWAELSLSVEFPLVDQGLGSLTAPALLPCSQMLSKQQPSGLQGLVGTVMTIGIYYGHHAVAIRVRHQAGSLCCLNGLER